MTIFRSVFVFRFLSAHEKQIETENPWTILIERRKYWNWPIILAIQLNSVQFSQIVEGSLSNVTNLTACRCANLLHVFLSVVDESERSYINQPEIRGFFMNNVLQQSFTLSHCESHMKWVLVSIWQRNTAKRWVKSEMKEGEGTAKILE